MRLLPMFLLACLCFTHAPHRAEAQSVPGLALTPEQLTVLPQHQVSLTFGNPPTTHSFEGPLVWDVLASSGAVDPARHDDAVRQWLQVRGADGYTAVIALGELSPEFEGKAAILAIQSDSVALDAPRLVLPGDHRAGRSVRQVVGLSVEPMQVKAR